MKKILINFNHTPEKDWLGDDYLIYDRSDIKNYLADFPQDKIIYEENVGNADYSKLRWLVENYDDLPDVFLWGKSNLFKYIEQEEWEKVKDNTTFTPLLSKNHKTYSDRNGVVCYYAGGMYHERNDITQAAINQFSTKYFNTYGEFAHAFQLPNPPFIPFPPGGSFILTKERVHRYSKDYYERMASILDYATLPSEAQMCERAYYSMWR